MTITRAAMLISKGSGNEHEGLCGGRNSNMIHLSDEVRVWACSGTELAGEIPKQELREVARPALPLPVRRHTRHSSLKPSTPQPGPTERRCSRLASSFRLLRLQNPSAHHLRDTCWPCT
jgi:hypothetical protein